MASAGLQVAYPQLYGSAPSSTSSRNYPHIFDQHGIQRDSASSLTGVREGFSQSDLEKKNPPERHHDTKYGDPRIVTTLYNAVSSASHCDFEKDNHTESMDDLETDGIENRENLSCEGISLLSDKSSICSVDFLPIDPNLYLGDGSKHNKMKSDIETNGINFVNKSQETTVKYIPGESYEQWPQENGCPFNVKAVDMDRRQPLPETVVKKITKTHTDLMSIEYRHDHLHRGRCLIVSNSEFRDKKNRPKRTGSLRDANTLRNQFQALGFHPIKTKDGLDEMIHQNLSRQELMQILSEVTDPLLNDHSDYDCFVCVVLSYGLEGAVVCPGETEDVYLEINSILEHFSPQKCPSLAMKPKLFFIQGCTPYEIIENQAMAKIPSSTIKRPMMKTAMPLLADCLVQFSVVDGCLGWGRKNNRGLSYFVQAICQTLKKFCILKLEEGQKSREICSLLLSINRAFMRIFENADFDIDERFCLPVTVSTLTKQMYFYPKSPPNDLEIG